MLNFLNYQFNVKKNKNFDKIEVKGLHQFKAFNYNVPGDISSASFFIVLTLLSNKSKIVIKNVNINHTRIGIITILNKMGAGIKLKEKRFYNGEEIADIHVRSRKKLKSVNCPSKLNSSAIDEFLIIFLAAAKAKGVSKFKDLEEMNKKESKRLNLAIKFLKLIGIKVERFKEMGTNLVLTKNFEIKNFLKDHGIFFIVHYRLTGWELTINDKDSFQISKYF